VNLAEVVRQAAGTLPDVDTATDPDGAVVWSRGGQPFAVLGADGTAAEFRLDPAVASAAAKTPDVVTSGRSAGWVRFRPEVLDNHGRDRALAWLQSAHRRAISG
jgi:hypothetical protein